MEFWFLTVQLVHRRRPDSANAKDSDRSKWLWIYLARVARALSNLSYSLGTEFEPFRVEIERCSKQVKSETLLAESQASDQERQLQIIERKSASESRAFLQSGIARLKKKTDRNIQFQIERSERDASKEVGILLLPLANKHFRKA